MSDQSHTSGLFKVFDQVLIWISLLLGGGALVFMTGFSVWNVLVMRKALNQPITGAEDILILVLVAVVALSIPLGARSGAHIEIEVMEARMSTGFARISKIVMKLMCIALLVIMAWQLWHAGQSAAKFGETTQQLLLSYEPFYYLLAASVSIYALVLIFDIWHLIRRGEVANMPLGGDAP